MKIQILMPWQQWIQLSPRRLSGRREFFRMPEPEPSEQNHTGQAASTHRQKQNKYDPHIYCNLLQQYNLGPRRL